MCTPGQLPLSDRQRINRQKCARFLQYLVLPPHTADFPPQFLDSPTHGLQGCDNDIDHFDILPLAAAVHVFIKTDPVWAYQPRYLRPLPELLAAIAELLAWRQPHNAPTLHKAWTIRQDTRAEFHILKVLNYELATPTLAAWIDIFRRCLSLWEEQQLLLPQHPNLPEAPPNCLTVLISLQKLMSKPNSFGANSKASQTGTSAWFISVAFWVCLSPEAAR